MFKEAILRGADAVDALKKFDPEIRASYMNASEALSCIRKQWYAKNDAERDGPENWGYARRGHAVEHYAVKMLQAANVPMMFTGDDQLSLQDDDVQISCTPDGMAQYDDEWWAVEFKSIDPRIRRDKLPRDTHIRQVQIAAAMIAKHCPDLPEIRGCRLIYINCSDFNDIYEFSIPLKPKILEQLQGRAARLLRETSARRLQREGRDNGGDECRSMCPFKKICGVAGAATTTAQGRKGGADLSKQVDDYLNAKAAEDDAKATKNAAAELIKAQLHKHGMTDTEVDGHSVKLTQRQGSVSYANVVKDHIDLDTIDLSLYRGASSDILTIK